MPHGPLTLAMRNGLPEAYAYGNKTIEVFRKNLDRHKEKYKT
jgi:hypothetical protein